MKQIEEFKNLISEKKFYEAHEALEEVWFPIRKKKNDCCIVLKGFINGAVCLELFKRGKLEQSKNVYKNYLKYVINDRIDNTDNKEKFINLKAFMDQKLRETFK